LPFDGFRDSRLDDQAIWMDTRRRPLLLLPPWPDWALLWCLVQLIAGCDNGSIQLFDVDKMRASLLLAARRNPRSASPSFLADSAMGRHAGGWMGGGPAYAHEAAAQT
jgi:hypothetical protein